MTGALIALLLFPVVGLALSRFVGRMQPFAAGCGVVGAVLWITALCGVPLVPVVIALFVLSAAILFWKRNASKEEPVRYPWLPTILAAVPAAWLLFVVTIVPLRDFDGRAFWLLKARAIAHEGSVSGPFFRGATTSPRNGYPLLMPLSSSAVMQLAGEADDRYVRHLFAFFALCFALELRFRLARLVSPSAGAWAAAVFLWLPQMIIEREGGATSAYNDIVVGLFVAGAFFELVERASPLRFGIWLAFLPLTKSEGLPLAILLLTIGAFVFRRRVLQAAVPVGAALAILFTWRSGIPRSDELDFASLILTLPRNVFRFGESLLATLEQLVAVRDWGGFLIVVAIAVAVLFQRREWRALALSGAVVLPMLALYAAVFAVSDWDMSVMRENLAPRVMTHVLAPLFYVCAVAARKRETLSPC